MHWSTAAWCGIGALLVADMFLPVLHRAPMRMRAKLPGLHCSRCGTALAPVQRRASTVRLGRVNECDVCGSRVWSRWPWFEVLVALAAGATGLGAGWSESLPLLLVFAVTGMLLIVIDIRHHLLPNRIIYTGLLFALVAIAAMSAATGDWFPLLSGLGSMAAAWMAFYLLWLAYPKGMGFGDVRLAAWLGLTTGWLGAGNTVIAIVCGVFLGAIGGILSVVLRRTGMKDPIPYGPFLISGAAISLYFGPNIASAVL